MSTWFSMPPILAIAWLVAVCTADSAMEIDNHDARLVRRENRKRRSIPVVDTVVAQIQPQGDVLSPELADHIGDGVLERMPPSGLEEIFGASKVRKSLSNGLAESMSTKTDLEPWVQATVATLKKRISDDTVADEALQRKLGAMKKSQLMRLARAMDIELELIDDANDEEYAKDALMKLLLNYKASHQNIHGKSSRLTSMVARADGVTEKVGKPSAEDLADLADLDNVENPDDSPNAHVGKVTIEHKFRGCFGLANESNLSSDFHDLACVTNLEGESPCRGGLPFFRLPMAAGQSYLDCFTFCLSKGLDLSGILALEKNKECRCGATLANTGAWCRQEPKKQLLLPSTKLKANDPDCMLLVWEYTGGLTEDDSVPFPLLQMSEDDRKYIESIATGHDITQEQGPDDEIINDTDETSIHGADINSTSGDNAEANISFLKMSGGCQDDPSFDCGMKKEKCRSPSAGATIRAKCPMACGMCTKSGSLPQLQNVPFRRCYPHKCAGGGPWLTKRSDGNVYIPYFFENNVDNIRKTLFQRAVQEYHSKTCIRWQQTTSNARPPRISVGIYDTSLCWASLGYPGSSGTHKINLGNCKFPGNLGVVIHELGHAIGMNHEQKRVDAKDRAMIGGEWKGPHLKMMWWAVHPDRVPQWVATQDTYVGSAYDGDGDHWWNYAKYDFESIMHYPRNGMYDTIPSSYNSVVGQDAGLSTGDVLQIKDMYQCGKPGTPAPTPAPGRCWGWFCKFAWQCGWGVCRGCGHCGGLIAQQATLDGTVTNHASSLREASVNGSVDNEDPDDDIAVWVADAWGACKKGKIICERSRQIVCENPNGKELKDIECDPSQKPLSKQACKCSELAELPEACAQDDSTFGGKSCTKWRGLDCAAIDGLQANCPHICGLC